MCDLLSWSAEPCPPVAVACGERGRAFSEGINVDDGGRPARSFWAHAALSGLCARPGLRGCSCGAGADGRARGHRSGYQRRSDRECLGRGARRSDQSAKNGRSRKPRAAFVSPSLPVGTYEVRTTYDGFEPYVHAGVTLAIGQTARLAVAMRPAGVVESVAVSAQPPALDSRQTSVTTDDRRGAYRGAARPQPELSGIRAARARCDPLRPPDDRRWRDVDSPG